MGAARTERFLAVFAGDKGHDAKREGEKAG